MLLNRSWFEDMSSELVTWGSVADNKIFVGNEPILYASDLRHIKVMNGDKVLVVVNDRHDSVQCVLSGDTERVRITTDWSERSAFQVSENADMYESALMWCKGSRGRVLMCDFPVEALNPVYEGFNLYIPEESVVARGNVVPTPDLVVVMGQTRMAYAYTLGGTRIELPQFEGEGVKEFLILEHSEYDGWRIPYTENTEMAEIELTATGEVTRVPDTPINVHMWGVPEGALVKVKIPEELFTVYKNMDYYPYLLDGTMLYTVGSEEAKTEAAPATGECADLINRELRKLTSEYIDAVDEILENAPDVYRTSNTPLLSALRWALAERRGRL